MEHDKFDTTQLDEIHRMLDGEDMPEQSQQSAPVDSSAKPGVQLDAAGLEALRENQQDAAEDEQPKGYDNYTLLRDLVHMLAVVTVIFVFFFRLVAVSGDSMFPTFVNTDWLVLESNFIYREIDRGDVVVLNVEAPTLEGPIVKRVIATEGQTVDIDFERGDVFVDGELQIEPYIFEPTYEGFHSFDYGLEYPLTVPDGHIFVMGDNRNHSLDSRAVSIGCVSEERVLGKVLLILFPGKQTDEVGEVTGGRNFARIGAIS